MPLGKISKGKPKKREIPVREPCPAHLLGVDREVWVRCVG